MDNESEHNDCQLTYEKTTDNFIRQPQFRYQGILPSLFFTFLLIFIFFRPLNTFIWTNERNDTERGVETNLIYNSPLESSGCFKCSRLRNFVRRLNFKEQIVTENNGICCANRIHALLDRLLQVIESIPPPFLRLNTLPSGKWGVTANPAKHNKLKDREDTLGNGLSRYYGYIIEKAALHLKGTYNITRRKMTWYNIAAPSALTLSPDMTEVIIATSGNYYMYASIQYTRKIKRGRSYSLYQQCPNGVSEIDIVQEITNATDGQQLSSTQRVVYLTRGDRIFIHFPSDQTSFVSTEEDAHVWGMFEV